MTLSSGRHAIRAAGASIAAASGLALVAAAVCVSAHDPIKTRVTWTGDISRVIAARCVSCHYPGVRDTMSLATYEDARPWARAIKEEVMTRRMPKWQAVRGYGDFSNDPSLSPFDIALVAAWADGGAPKGTEADMSRGALPIIKSRSADEPPRASREVTFPCGDRPAPEGTLIAVRPVLEKGGAVGIAVTLPNGHREIVAWIRGYDPEFPTTYRLRTPLVVSPDAIVSAQPATPGCRVTFTVLGS
jgi:hypothetical protein